MNKTRILPALCVLLALAMVSTGIVAGLNLPEPFSFFLPGSEDRNTTKTQRFISAGMLNSNDSDTDENLVDEEIHFNRSNPYNRISKPILQSSRNRVLPKDFIRPSYTPRDIVYAHLQNREVFPALA